MLADQGLEGRPLTLVVNIENTAKSAVANYVEQQLESAGLVVTVDRLPWEEYQETVAAGDFDLYIGEVYLTPDFDLSPLLGPGGSLNYGGWTSSTISGLLSSFRTAQGMPGRPRPPACACIWFSRRPSPPSASEAAPSSPSTGGWRGCPLSMKISSPSWIAGPFKSKFAEGQWK